MPPVPHTSSEPASEEVEPTRRRAPSTLLSLGLAVVVALGVVYAGSALVVRRRVLEPAMYHAAIADSAAPRRVYTEVIPDPELSELVRHHLGDLGVDPALAPQATALATNVMRFALPPERIEAALDTVISAIVGYVRGDVDDLVVDVDLGEVVARFDEATVALGRSLLASAVEDVAATLASYEPLVREFVDELASGRVPDRVPVLGGTEFDPEAVTEVILDATGLGDDPVLREQIVATVLVHDERNALISAASDALAARGRDAADEVRGVESDAVVDVVGELADRAGTSTTNIAASLDGARSVADWFAPLPALAATLAAVGAAVALAVAHRERWRAAVAWIAGSLGVAALGLVVLWRVIGAAIDTPLERLTGTGPGTWNLPVGARSVLRDVATGIGDGVAGLVVRIATVLLALALAGGVVVVVSRFRPRERRARAGVALAAAVAVVAVPVAGLRAEPSVATRACNGAPELCDRRYDEVAYAATHNAMSSPGVVPIWPEHDSHLRAQLDAGVRALLIDTKYWEPVDGAAALQERVDPDSLPLPPDVTAALWGLLGDAAEGRPGTFLCHNSCMFGAQPLVEGLEEVRDFLDDNPDEVVTLIIQDEISVADTVAAFEEAGLVDVAYEHRDGAWPTLGEMIDDGDRLVVFAENEAGPPAWYANAFEVMQETPYLVLERDRFTCEPHRGVPDGTLFQLNHWVQRIAPDPADAAVVNAYDFLLDRARRCQDERGLLPNFVAVNFYSIGDLFAVVDTLNGLDA